MSNRPIISWGSISMLAKNIDKSEELSLKPDANGFYDVPLGGLNVNNSVGEVYAEQGSIKLFEDSSDLMRRLTTGQLRIELGHPEFTPGMKPLDYIARLHKIKESNVCGYIGEVYLVRTNKREDGTPDNVIEIRGKVKPDGPHAEVLKRRLEDPTMNVAFSIRSFTDNHVNHMGKTIKVLKKVITWDLVTEPGIKRANKFQTLGIESRDYLTINTIKDTDLNSFISDIENIERNISQESDRKNLNDTIEILKGYTAKSERSFYNW